MINKDFRKYTWANFFKYLKQKEYFKKLMFAINNLYRIESICPKRKDLFKAFLLTPLKSVKVVIIGQDPYYQKGVANGLSFATNNNYFSSSLRNINNLLFNNLGQKIKDTSLNSWARQGILLINKTLIAKEGRANFYDYLEFDYLLKDIITLLNKVHTNLVYVLLGASALNLKKYIAPNNLILCQSHPSGLSNHKKLGEYPSFNDSNLFININNYLTKHNLGAIIFGQSND